MRTWIAVLIGLIGLALTFATRFESHGISRNVAEMLVGAGYVFVVVTIMLLIRRKDERVDLGVAQDERVDLGVAQELLRRTLGLENPPPLLCRRHVTTKAQGDVLGCCVAEAAFRSSRHARELAMSAALEIYMERDNGLFELGEHMAYVYGLVTAFESSKPKSLMDELTLMAASQPSSSEMARDAEAVRHNLLCYAEALNKFAYMPLKKLHEEMRMSYRGDVTVPDGTQKRIKLAVGGAQSSLRYLADGYLRAAEDSSMALLNRMRKTWHATQIAASSMEECRASSLDKKR